MTAYQAVTAPLFSTAVIGGSLNTSGIADDAEAAATIEHFMREIEAPATDVIRFGPDTLLDAVIDFTSV